MVNYDSFTFLEYLLPNGLPKVQRYFNPLQPGVAFLYPLKTFRFSDVFRGYKKATPGCNGIKNVLVFSVKDYLMLLL